MVKTMGDTGLDILEHMHGHYTEDEFFARVIAEPQVYSDFSVHNGLLYKRTGDTAVLCIPNISKGSKNIWEMVIRHAHSLLAHLGHKKTIQLLQEEVWW